jgi:hypothetical protein
MKQGFFEAIGIAAIERIHSQMLYWMFLQENSVLSSEAKADVLKLFNPQAGSYKKFESWTEYENIDLLIRADNDLYVIENKIKSSEHDSQLSKYKESVKKMKEFEGCNIFHIYLTLIEEKPSDTDWNNVTYRQLFTALKQHRIPGPSNADACILNEYIDSLETLTNITTSFLQNNGHRHFSNVFTDGGKTKKAKGTLLGGYNDEQKYIARNQLETLLQRAFLSMIAHRMSIPNNHYFVEETRGTALLRIVIVKSIPINKGNYDVQIEFQRNTVKIKLAAVAEEYPTSKFDSVTREAKEIMSKVAGEYGYHPHRGKTRAYLSMTKEIGKELWNMNVDEIVDRYNVEYQTAKDIAPKIEHHLRIEQGAG